MPGKGGFGNLDIHVYGGKYWNGYERNSVRGCGLGSFGSGNGPVVGSCEYVNGSFCSTWRD